MRHHHKIQFLGQMSSSFYVKIIFYDSVQEIRCWIFLFTLFFLRLLLMLACFCWEESRHNLYFLALITPMVGMV